MHCARAVHVQMFCTCNYFAAPTGQTVRTADAISQGHMSAIPAYMFFWLPYLFLNFWKRRTCFKVLRIISNFSVIVQYPPTICLSL